MATPVTREIVLPELEESLCRYVHRPPGRWLAKRLIATRVTPNQVTLFGGCVGVAAGLLLIAGARQSPLRVAGALALLAACILDCADGELARARSQASPMGMMLDGLTDNVIGTSVFLGMAYNVVVYTGQAWFWLLGIAAGLSAAAHVWVFDAKKKQYLECLRLAEPEEPIPALAERRIQVQREGHWLEAFLLRAFQFFRRAQSMGVSAEPSGDPGRFWQDNRDRMHAWTFMGSSTHFFLLYVAAFGSPFWPPAFLACVLVYAVGLNAIFLYLLIGKWKT